jgi:hypothetical protein
MAKAVKRPAESWVYVLKADRDLPMEEQSRFTLRPMTHNERAAAHDDLVRTRVSPDGDKTVQARTRQQALVIALRHIVSIENFPSENPQPWPATTEARAAYVEQLDDEYVLELGNEVFARRGLLGDEGAAIKNSSPPGRTSRSGGSEAAETSTPATHAP